MMALGIFVSFLTSGFFGWLMLMVILPLANDDAQSELHGDPARPRVEDAGYPHGLAYPGSLAVPPDARNALPLREHRRPLPLAPRRLSREAPARRDNLHVHRVEGGRDRRAERAELSALRRLVVHGRGDPAGGAVRAEEHRVELELSEPDPFFEEDQQGR